MDTTLNEMEEAMKSSRPLIAVTLLALVVPWLALALAPSSAVADEWTDFRGANRQGKSAETGLLKSWPGVGPDRVWMVEGLGEGYSSATVGGGRVFVTGMLPGLKGWLFAHDLDGKELWRVHYGPEVKGAGYPGARSSPTIDGDRVYITSGHGLLACYEAATGKEVWKLDMLKTFTAKNIRWGISESVLVDGDHVIVCPGGSDSVVALDKMTGEVAWKTAGIGLPASYTSPVLMERAGRSIVVAVLTGAIVGVDRADGKLLWKHPFTQKYGVLCVSPIIKGDLVFTSAGYTGAVVLEVAADGASVTERWNTKTFDITHGGAVEVDGFLYGSDSKKDREEWMCVELETGKTRWTDKGVGKGCVVAADGMLYIYGEKTGELALAKASPEKLEIVSRIQIAKGDGWHWGHPSISDGRLYLRHGGALICFDIKAK